MHIDPYKLGFGQVIHNYVEYQHHRSQRGSTTSAYIETNNTPSKQFIIMIVS